jgi:hypothetical protein
MRARHFQATVTFLGKSPETKLFTAVNFAGNTEEYRAILKRQFPQYGELTDLKEIGGSEIDAPIRSVADLGPLEQQARAAADNASA